MVMSDRWFHPDPFDPDHMPPHWEDEEGNFAGWMSEAEQEEMYRQMADAALAQVEAEGVPDRAVDIADLDKGSTDMDDDGVEF
jgi:hypothetical protein